MTSMLQLNPINYDNSLRKINKVHFQTFSIFWRDLKGSYQITNSPHAPMIWMLIFLGVVPVRSPSGPVPPLSKRLTFFLKSFPHVTFLKSKNKSHFRLRIPRFPSQPHFSPLKSGVFLQPARLPAVLCPRFSTAGSGADPSCPCVITHRERLAQLCGRNRRRNVDESRAADRF